MSSVPYVLYHMISQILVLNLSNNEVILISGSSSTAHSVPMNLVLSKAVKYCSFTASALHAWPSAASPTVLSPGVAEFCSLIFGAGGIAIA